MVDYTTVESVLIEVVGGDQDGKKFYFDGLEVSKNSDKTSSNQVTITFPQEDQFAESSITINLGVARALQFNFKLLHQTQDRSKSTNTTEVKTFGEILDYLDIILFPGVSLARYKITVVTKFRTTTDIYYLDNYSFDTDGGVYPTGNMSFVWVNKE